MKKILQKVLVSCALIICTSCDKEDFTGIESISFENYPKVDGSTSVRALNVMVACKLLGVRYSWQEITGNLAVAPGHWEWVVMPKTGDIPTQYKEDFLINVL